MTNTTTNPGDQQAAELVAIERDLCEQLTQATASYVTLVQGIVAACPKAPGYVSTLSMQGSSILSSLSMINSTILPQLLATYSPPAAPVMPEPMAAGA